MQEVESSNGIAKYNSYVRLMYSLLRDLNISRDCKITIYHSILKPILLYGSGAWSLTTITESKLQASEMRVLRMIKRATRKDRIGNTIIRAELHVPPLLEEIDRSRLRWYGHVMRIEGDKKPKSYLMLKPEVKRLVGRP